MARLNNRTSTMSGGRRSRSSSSDSDSSSEQENQDPEPGSQRRHKGKGRADTDPDSSHLPTPSTDASESTRGQKRKRNHVPGPELEDVVEEMDEVEAKYTRYFDPNQNPEIRRQIKRKSRALEREFNDNRDELLKGDAKTIQETIVRAEDVFKNVKQTNDATVDARLFVNISELAYKRTAQLVVSDASTGLDIDQFLNKCISYMQRRSGAAEDEAPGPSQRRRTQRATDSDDEDEGIATNEPLDFEHLGRHACFPYNSRPACPSFLLGPLSVEKKQRKQTQRTARQTKNTNAQETRPEALTRADMAQSDENALTAICKRVRLQLEDHCAREAQAMSETFSRADDVDSEYGKAWLARHRFRPEQGPWLFDFVINPQSFGQTVENMFYVSFLIKEGYVGIEMDGDGLPVLLPARPEEDIALRQKNYSRKQAVFSLDNETYNQLIEAFDIEEPMIPHRQEERATQINQTGWYT